MNAPPVDPSTSQILALCAGEPPRQTDGMDKLLSTLSECMVDNNGVSTRSGLKMSEQNKDHTPSLITSLSGQDL